MKRGLTILITAVLLMSFVIAQETCDLKVTLLNQEPYPAVQGDAVKIVFQVEGIESTTCANLNFELIEEYPFILDPSSKKNYAITSGVYSKDYANTFLAPFKVRVDENALDGENPIEVRYTYGMTSQSKQTKSFNIEVQDVRADFEVFVEDYNSLTEEITFDILNIGETDIEALTVEIPTQEGVLVKGANKNIVGDLDSNEDTSADFTLSTALSEIQINFIYSDLNNQRRSVSKTVTFNSENFKSEDTGNGSFWKWIIVILVIAGIIYWHYRKRKKRHLAEQQKQRG